jgi:hypothetical protein
MYLLGERKEDMNRMGDISEDIPMFRDMDSRTIFAELFAPRVKRMQSLFLRVLWLELKI